MKKPGILPAIVDESVESAKGFLSKLIMPAVEETGLLIRDPVLMWKFRNEVKMLNKAKEICEKNNINPKAISLKLLVPLLSNAALEEDDEMQDKWAILLSNLVDSEQNIENHVFPYILSQLSRNEFLVLESAYDSKQARIQQLQNELDEFRLKRPQQEVTMKKRISEIPAKLAVAQIDKDGKKVLVLEKEKKELELQLWWNTHQDERISNNIKKPESLPILALLDFEESNLIRLGLIKEVKEFFANSQTLEIPIDPGEANYETGKINLDLDVEVDSKTEIILTKLGELFISACKEKQKKAN
jgi:hypothetical protein